jgi:hypothetical protein
MTEPTPRARAAALEAIRRGKQFEFITGQLGEDDLLRPEHEAALYYSPFHAEWEQRDIPDKHLRCAQCLGEPDGTERMMAPINGGEPVLLHEPCRRFFRGSRW